VHRQWVGRYVLGALGTILLKKFCLFVEKSALDFSLARIVRCDTARELWFLNLHCIATT